MIMEMNGRSAFCDAFVVMSAPSAVRVKAIVDHIEKTLEEEGWSVKNREGYAEGLWVLLNYEDVVVHIFYHETRRFYDLENLWGDAPKQKYLR